MLAAVAAVVIVAFVVTTWLLTIASHAKPGTDRANSRLDAVRTGLAAGALFAEATFSGERSLSFMRSRVLSPDAELTWPTGWCLGPDGKGGHTVVRAKDDGSS